VIQVDSLDPGLGIESVGFVLAVDGCGRGCSHCPAFGIKQRPTTAPLDSLRGRLDLIRPALPGVDFTRFRTIHAWRIGDMLDYRDQQSDITHDAVSVAEAWLTRLGQPLYVVTNGSIGSAWRREVVHRMAQNPHLFSQVKLTITLHDPRSEKPASYVRNMAHDVAALWPVSLLPANRVEASVSQTWFRINVKANQHDRPRIRELLREIFAEAGLSAAEANALLAGEDPRLAYKDVYDLRAEAGLPKPKGSKDLGAPGLRYHHQDVRDQFQLGFHADGTAFLVDMAAFGQHDLVDAGGNPVAFDHFFPVRVSVP